jgi:hypothetical protein
MQSESVLHVVLQLVVEPQRYGAQLPGETVEQAPPPVHEAVGVKVVPLQLAAPQVTAVEACWQPPMPLQAPVLPQTPFEAHCPAGAAAPAEIEAQLPRPLMLQAWQVPQGPEPQQTPSVQKPLMHWLPLPVHAWPLGFKAQLLVAPEPWQVYGATQSLSAVQEVLHALVPQT